MYHFLGLLPEIVERGRPLLPTRVYRLPGGTELLKEFWLADQTQPTPSIPIVRTACYTLCMTWLSVCTQPNLRSLGQDRLEKLLHEHLERHGCHVEFNTTLVDFTRAEDYVEAHIVKSGIDQDVTEKVKYRWLIGADGAKGMSHSYSAAQIRILTSLYAGGIRKQVGLELNGETRGVNERFVTGDLEVKNLSNDVSTFLRTFPALLTDGLAVLAHLG